MAGARRVGEEEEEVKIPRNGRSHRPISATVFRAQPCKDLT